MTITRIPEPPALDLEQLYDLWRCGACVGACDAYMPRTEAVAALLGQFETRWFHEQCSVLPAAFGDDLPLLADARLDWLLNLPRSEVYPKPDLWFLPAPPDESEAHHAE